MNLSLILNGLWRASWQASLLAVVVLIVQKLLGGRIGGRGRYALWAIVLLRLLLPVLPQSRFSLFNLTPMSNATATVQPAKSVDAQSAEIPIIIIGSTDAKSQATRAIAAMNERALVLSPPANISWSRWIFAAWMAGIIILSIRVMQVCWMLSRMTGKLPVVSDEPLLRVVQACAHTLRLRNMPGVLSGETVQTPAVVGLFRPKLLLPAHVLAHCSDREIRLIIMHELAHLKRHDIAGNWLIAIASIVHWFNPLVWLAASRMRADRELACDELVLAHCSGEAHAYGQTLVKLIEILSPAAAPRQLVGILESTTPMQRRVRMIAQFNPKQSSRWALTLAVLFALGCVALTDAVRGDSKPAPTAGAPASQPSNIPPSNFPHAQPTAAAQETKTVAYDVDDLGEPLDPKTQEEWRLSLVRLVQEFVEPESWKDVGGKVGSIQAINGRLIIQQTPTAHEKIVELLKMLKTQQSPSTPQPQIAFGVASVPPPAPDYSKHTIVSDAQIDAANLAAAAALHKKLPEVKLDPVTFSDLIDFLRESSGANIVANWRALETIGVDKNQQVVLRLKDVSLETVLTSAIRQIEQPQSMAIVIDRGIITVTTQAEASSYMLTKVYDVSDLTATPQAVSDLAKVVEGLASPDDGVQIFGNNLIITALPDMHEQIDKLLADLRRHPGTQPALEKKLTISTLPAGAAIEIDGEKMSENPAVYDFVWKKASDEHTITATLKGYKVKNFSVPRDLPGQRLELNLDPENK